MTPTILGFIKWGLSPSLILIGITLLWFSGQNGEASIQSEADIAEEPRSNIILRGVMIRRITQGHPNKTWIHVIDQARSVFGVLVMFSNAAKQSGRSVSKARIVKASILLAEDSMDAVAVADPAPWLDDLLTSHHSMWDKPASLSSLFKT
jgi:hypothetical protein